MLARVPWAPPFAKPDKAKPRRLTDARRRRMVEAVADIMRAGFEAGAPSKFAYEASCRRGIRSALCLQEWMWPEADAAAEDVVARALGLIGAVRPTWREGQPEWTQDGALPIEREHCMRCRKPLPEGHWRWCSKLCSDAWHRDRRDMDLAAEHRARRRAREAAAAKRLPERECDHCGRTYRPNRPDQRFCRVQCNGLALAAMHRR